MTTNLLTVALAAAGIATILPYPVQAGSHSTVSAVNGETSQLMKDVERRAYDLREHADAIHDADAVRLTRAYFIEQSNAVKDDVNAMGKAIVHLQSLESEESPADRDVVERARMELAEIAKVTDESIQYLNEHPNRLWTQEYRDMTASLSHDTDALWSMLHDAVRMDNLKAREQKLQKNQATSEAGGQP